jgi:hypothetical protein
LARAASLPQAAKVSETSAPKMLLALCIDQSPSTDKESGFRSADAFIQRRQS